MNFIELKQPEDILDISSKMSDRTKIFLTGYSAAPKDSNYGASTRQFIESLLASLGNNKATLITSPTATGESIDAIGTIIANNNRGVNILYITGEDYLKYVDATQLPPEVDRAKFEAAPKYFYKDAADYSRASAMAADMLIVTGGRDVAVQDFMNALECGKSIVLLENPSLPTGFDAAKGRPNNAAEYLNSMLQAAAKGEPLPYPGVKGFDLPPAN